MRGKVARELRRLSKFNPHSKRQYETWTIPKLGWVAQFDKEGKLTPVKKTVPCNIIECVSGPRKVYKHLKNFYKGKANEQELNVLPKEEELTKIKSAISADQEAQKEVTDEQRNKEEV